MKIIERSATGKMIKIGEDKTAPYYKAEGDILEIANKIKDGTEVTFRYEKIGNTKHIIFLAEGKVSVPTELDPLKKQQEHNEVEKDKKVELNKSTEQPPSRKEYTPEEKKSYFINKQQSIERQAIGHMVSETLVSMQGLVNEGNVFDLIDKLYAIYSHKVSS